MDDLYTQSRILVLPSLCFEGFPNVITRAMASGKPVVASRLGGVPEIVEDGHSGLLFEPGNTTELVTRIREIYTNLELCRSLGVAGRIKAEREYSSSAVYRRLMEILDKAKQLHIAESSMTGQGQPGPFRSRPNR